MLCDKQGGKDRLAGGTKEIKYNTPAIFHDDFHEGFRALFLRFDLKGIGII
jgi:hypothetical protein